MANSRLPKHLSGLLRHAPDVDAAAVPQEPSVITAAAKRRRKLKQKRNTAGLESKLAAASPAGAPEENPKRVRRKVAKKTVSQPAEAKSGLKLRSAEGPKEGVKKKSKSDVKGTKMASSARPSEGGVTEAEQDAAMIKSLETRLGISGDRSKRRKLERSIFADLGLDDDLGLPENETCASDDEVEEACNNSKRGRQTTKAKATDEDFGSLLDGILGV